MEPDLPVPFGYKCSWIAIKSEEPQSVARSLGLGNLRKSSWQTGISKAYAGEAFVTPPIKGWVLVASTGLPDVGDKSHRDRLTPLVQKLAKEFSDVQSFGTHRVVEYHAWIRATDGKIVRRFAYLGERGETLCDEGERTADEKRLGLVFDDNTFPDEQHVSQLAGAWSIDPTMLDKLKPEKSVGLLGTLPGK